MSARLDAWQLVGFPTSRCPCGAEPLENGQEAKRHPVETALAIHPTCSFGREPER